MFLYLCFPQGTRWFGEDGQLKRLSCPLKEKPTRPPVVNVEEVDPLLQTEWVKVCAVVEKRLDAEDHATKNKTT